MALRILLDVEPNQMFQNNNRTMSEKGARLLDLVKVPSCCTTRSSESDVKAGIALWPSGRSIVPQCSFLTLIPGSGFDIFVRQVIVGIVVQAELKIEEALVELLELVIGSIFRSNRREELPIDVRHPNLPLPAARPKKK
jgi:hypothetical protein